MGKMTLAAALAAVWLVIPASARGLQRLAPRLDSSQVVRLTLPAPLSRREVGRVARVSDDSLWLRIENRKAPDAIRDSVEVQRAWSAVTDIEVGSRRTRLRGAGRGLVRGVVITAIGTASLGALALATHDDGAVSGDGGIEGAVFIGALALVPITSISTVWGFVAPGTRWMRAEIKR